MGKGDRLSEEICITTFITLPEVRYDHSFTQFKCAAVIAFPWDFKPIRMTPLSRHELSEVEKVMEKTAESIFIGGRLNQVIGGFSDAEIVCSTEANVFFRVRFGVFNEFERDVHSTLFMVDRKTFLTGSVLGPVAISGGIRQFSA